MRLWNLRSTCNRERKLSQSTSETGRIRFQRARFQTPSSVSFFALTEFRGEMSVSSSQHILFVWQSELTEFFAELTEFAPKLSEAQWVLFSETVRLETVFRPFPTISIWKRKRRLIFLGAINFSLMCGATVPSDHKTWLSQSFLQKCSNNALNTNYVFDVSFLEIPFPKDPAVLKRLRRINSVSPY